MAAFMYIHDYLIYFCFCIYVKPRILGAKLLYKHLNDQVDEDDVERASSEFHEVWKLKMKKKPVKMAISKNNIEVESPYDLRTHTL